MNILFHMLLSGADEQLMVGNFMGDFVKGPLTDAYAPRIRQGLALHRKIDSFAQRDPAFQASRLRLSPRFGLYRGVLVDLFYDHFLARGWSEWSRVPFEEYCAASRLVVERYLPIMPPDLQGFVPVIFNELLPSYRSVAGIEAALRRMSRRVKRANPLGEGAAELTLHYDILQEDFRGFMAAVQCFVKQEITV